MSNKKTKDQKVNVEEKKEEQIPIDAQTAYTLKIREFDKKIAEAESILLGLNKDKAIFIYEASVQRKNVVGAAYDQTIKQILKTHNDNKQQEVDKKS